MNAESFSGSGRVRSQDLFCIPYCWTEIPRKHPGILRACKQSISRRAVWWPSEPISDALGYHADIDVINGWGFSSLVHWPCVTHYLVSHTPGNSSVRCKRFRGYALALLSVQELHHCTTSNGLKSENTKDIWSRKLTEVLMKRKFALPFFCVNRN